MPTPNPFNPPPAPSEERITYRSGDKGDGGAPLAGLVASYTYDYPDGDSHISFVLKWDDPRLKTTAVWIRPRQTVEDPFTLGGPRTDELMQSDSRVSQWTSGGYSLWYMDLEIDISMGEGQVTHVSAHSKRIRCVHGLGYC